MWDLVPSPVIEPGPLALKVWSLSHWTTREVLPLSMSPIDLVCVYVCVCVKIFF